MTSSEADRQAIAETLARYAFAADTLGNSPLRNAGDPDPALDSAIEQLRTCLTDDALVFLFFEGPAGPATQAGEGGPVEFARFVRSYFTSYGYLGTYHLIGNVVVDFDGPDTARVRSYINSTHWMTGDRILLAPILYVDDMRRDGGTWKISRREIQVHRFWVAEGYAPIPTDPTLARPPGAGAHGRE